MANFSGGWAEGVVGGLGGLEMRELNRRKMDQADAEIAFKGQAADIQKAQLGMQQDLHAIKMDQNARDSKIHDIDEIGAQFAEKNPSAWSYGLDVATRNGLIETDPVTGKRGIRGDNLRDVMAHLDTPVGVDEISKRDIAMYSDKLRNATTDEEKGRYEGLLNQAKAYNKGALKQMEIEQRAEDKEADRQMRITLAGMRGGGGGGNGLTHDEKIEFKNMDRLDRYNTSWQKGIDAAKKQYDKDMNDETIKPADRVRVATERWNNTVRELREWWQPKTTSLERKLGLEGPPAVAPKLGGAGGQPAAAPSATRKLNYNPANGKYE